MNKYAVLENSRISLSGYTVKEEKTLLKFTDIFKDAEDREFLFGMERLLKKGDDLIEIFSDYFLDKYSSNKVFYRVYSGYSWVHTFEAPDDDAAKLYFELGDTH